MSFRIKMTIFVSMVVVLSVGILTTTLLNYFEKSLTNEFDLRITSITNSVAYNLELPVMIGDREGVSKMVTSLLKTPDMVSVTIMRKGELMVKGTGDPVPRKLQRVKRAKIVSTEMMEDEFGGEGRSNEEVIGEVIIAFSTAKLKANINNTLKFAFLVTLMIIALAIVAGAYFISMALDPLSELLVTIGKVSSGDLKQRVENGSKDEVGQLATEFDKMVVALNEREDALMASEEQVRLLLNSTGEAIYGLDLDGVCTFANVACLEMLGYKEENELVGRRTHEVNHHTKKDGAPYPEEECRVYQAFRKGTGTHVDDELLWRADGTSFSAEYRSHPLTHNGKIVGAVVTFTDITEREQLQRQLMQSEKLSSIGTFISGVAHELNNPLTAVIGYSEILLDSADDLPEEYKDDLKQLASEAQRAGKIVHSLLKFTRKQKEGKRNTNINTILKDTISLNVYRLRTENIVIKEDLDDNLPLVMANMNQLQQVFMNIIINAHQAIADTNSEGTITIKSEKAEDEIVVTLENSGPPIPVDILDKIFDPFYTTKDIGEGTGLGLSISYGIIKEHGGRFQVENINSSGVRFIIAFPVSHEANLMAKPKAPNQVIPFNIRILVVEDESPIRGLLERLLAGKGAKVTTAENGLLAQKILENEKFDIILSDIKMPVCDGFELFEWIKKQQPENISKFVLLTGTIGVEVSDFCQLHGIQSLHKPIEGNKIIEMICKVHKWQDHGQ